MRELGRLLRGQRDYRLMLGAGLISLTGDWILRVGLAFQVYVLTGSTLASGGMMLASFLPHILLGSLAGVFVDRWDRRRTMIGVNLLHVATLMPLIVVRDAGDLWIVYGVALTQSCLQQFFVPAEQSLVPRLVRPDQLISANALTGQTHDISRLTGAALGGLLAGFGGLPLLAIADAATYLLSAGLLARMRHQSPRLLAERLGLRHAVRRLRAEWAEGLRISMGGSGLRLLFAFGVVTSIGEGAMGTLFAPFVRDELGGSEVTYGWIVSSQAVGGIVGGLVAAAFGRRLGAVRMWGLGALTFGLIDLTLFCYPLWSGALWPAFVCMVVVGVPGAFITAGTLTVFQQLTDDASRGRVFGAFFAAEGGACLIGILAAGVLGEAVGIIPILVVQGLAYVVAGLVVLALRRAVSPPKAQPEQVPQPVAG
ncbi:MFS transporter [Kribbella deserti]|uniref:MFS transporter n=1 Tax=Kribbella deserti TaxID=1926257 RepID=A0ABV6QT11_9ACTN